jgi:hypothetical protein
MLFIFAEMDHGCHSGEPRIRERSGHSMTG